MTPEQSGRANGDADSAARELVHTQRAANEELVLSSLRSQEAADASEAREGALLATAELRERLLGILGHDLRTPLSAITMSGGILVARGNLNEDDTRVVLRLLNSADRMSRMITQILDFTRARLGGGFQLEPRPTDVATLCRSVASELALSRSVSVQCSVEGDVTASLDGDRIAAVLSNIAGNAVEHARQGTSVTLHARESDADVVVEISNEGEPIAPDLLPHIFEPFRRAKQRVPSKAGNLGLGLYIAYEITRAHGGSLHARCAEGTTTFTLRLPREQPQRLPDPKVSEPHGSERTEG